VVTGTAAAGELIGRLCAQKERWLGLVGRAPANPIPNMRTIAAGCPCCIGRVVLQISLARALRQTGATRAFVEVPDGAHAASLEGVLAELPLSLSVIVARKIVLPEDAWLSPVDLECLGPES
jgi:hypothetical protein